MIKYLIMLGLVAAVYFAVKTVYRAHKNGGCVGCDSCGGGCGQQQGGCPHCQPKEAAKLKLEK